MSGNQKAGLKQGRLFYQIKKLEYQIEKERIRLKNQIAKKKSFSDKSVLRINRRLVKKCIRLYDKKEAYKKWLRKSGGETI